MPRTINVSLAEGGAMDYKYYTVADLVASLARLRTKVQTAWNNDKIEGDDALARAEGDCLADKDYFRQRIGEIETRKTNALAAIETIINTNFEPKTDVIDTLVESYAKQWSDTGLKVDELQGRIAKHIALDDWSSDGAQKYKQAAINQNNALSEFRQLCFDNSAACEQVAQVNAAIFNATYDSLETVASQIDTSPAVTGQDYYGRSYYVRSDSAAAKLEGLKTWMERAITTNGDWGATAYDIGSAIDDVRTSPANLGLGGRWPEAKAAPATDSHTDDMSSHTQQDIDAAEGSGSGEGTLDK